MPRSRTRPAMSRIRFSSQDLAPPIVLTQDVCYPHLPGGATCPLIQRMAGKYAERRRDDGQIYPDFQSDLLIQKAPRG
jgi:hypothetical protein